MIKKILFEEKINVKTKVSHKEELWAEDVNEIKEVVNNNADELTKGLKPAQTIDITANQPHEYTLPQNANLYSIRISGAATVKIGTTSGGNEINEYSPATSVVWTIGFRNESSVFFTSDTDITITPMIFQW